VNTNPAHTPHIIIFEIFTPRTLFTARVYEEFFRRSRLGEMLRARNLAARRRPLLLVRATSSSSRPAASQQQQQQQQSPDRSDAFEKGLPFLFRNNAPLGTLIALLGAIFAYNAISDLTAPREQVLPAGVAKVLPDGRLLMHDGSIRGG
jgi:hypothetical protein